MTLTYDIAVTPGDGIGREMMPEGLRVLEAAARRFDLSLRFTPIEWVHRIFERYVSRFVARFGPAWGTRRRRFVVADCNLSGGRPAPGA